MTPAEKKAIDKASYKKLVEDWRFAEANDPRFKGDDGVYYFKTMFARQNELEDKGWAISQEIGFTNPKYKEPEKKTRGKKNA